MQSTTPNHSDKQFAEWLRFMRRGDYARAWQISDQVLIERRGRSCGDLPRHERYCWDGTPLNNKRVLIRCYHGLGDTLQFIRYAPWVGRIANTVQVAPQPELIPLLRRMANDGIEFVGDDFAAFDAEIEVMELPHIFRTTLATVPRQIPYVDAERAPLQRAARLEIGLVWRAGKGWDARRSIPTAQLRPLAAVADMRIHLLQTREDCSDLPAGFGVMGQREQLADLASFMRALDLVISVDSMPAHLAGALGVPIWNLLHADADWRWMENRDSSPWYPTMRLFRQVTSGDWPGVINRVTAELRSLTERRPGALGLREPAEALRGI